MNDGEGLSIWGAKFEARVDFNKAIRDADSLDKQLERIRRNVDYLGTTGKSRIDAFAASLANAARAAGGILGASGSPIYPGIASGGGGAFGPYTPLDVQQPAGRLGAPMPGVFYYSSGANYALGRGTDWNWWSGAQPYSGIPQLGRGNYGWQWWSGAQPYSGIPQLPPPRPIPQLPAPRVMQLPAPRDPFYPYMDTARYQEPFGPWQPGLPQLPAPSQPSWMYGNMWYGIGQGAARAERGFGRALATPWPEAIRFDNPNLPPPSGWLQSNVTGPIRSFGAGMGNALNYQRIMRAAGMLYIGQNLANFGAFIGRSTIGEAMALEERQTLLQNALTSPLLGIDRETARARAATLTSGNYFAGMPVTAQEMGLSRPELAEQFRQLAPIIRLTARNQEEFQSGLQTGALARALLVARDPVQGTRGAMVALSELYSGGPDRFRSLSLRFELPRNRMREIEQEMGGPGTADPGQVIIQMLTEMGFGPDYLTMRAGTLAGQLGRSGALAANFKVELFDAAMGKVRDNLTRLNDAFEAWLDSDAGDRAIESLDNLFGRISGFFTSGPAALLSSQLNAAGGTMGTRALSQNIGDYMTARSGEYVDAAGRIVDASRAFSEAARHITGKELVRQLRQAEPQVFRSLGTRAFGYGAIGIGAVSLLDRFLMAGNVRLAGQALATGAGWGAAGSALTAGGVAAAGALLPMAAVAAGAGAVALGVQSRNIARDWREFAAQNPDMAIMSPELTGASLFAKRIAAFGANIARAPGVWFGDGQFLPDPGQQLSKTMQQGGVADTLGMMAALQYFDTPDLGVIEATLIGQLADMNQEYSLGYTPAEFGAMIQGALAPLRSGDISDLGRIATGVALRRAAAGGHALVGPDGRPISLNPAVDMESSDLIAAAWSQIVGITGGGDAALDYLRAMLASLKVIEDNTAAEAESAYSYIRPSQVGDIFAGYNESPDMRFIRRTGLPRPGISAVTRAKASDGFALSSGHVAGQYVMDIRGRSVGVGAFMGHDSYLGGMPGVDVTITDTYGSQRPYGTHGGIDYVLGGGGEIRAPYAGTVEYLTKPEDFAAYRDILGAGYDEYGNTAVFRDPLGISTVTYSHLSDRTMAFYGTSPRDVVTGQTIGIQGSTGRSTGPHVHQSLFINDGSGAMRRIDPMYGENLYDSMPLLEQGLAGGANINVQIGDVQFNLSGGTPQELAKQATDELLNNPDVRDAVEQQILEGIMRNAVPIYQRAKSTLERRGVE